MKRDEIIKLADECLNSVNDIRTNIKAIDAELKKETYTSEEIEKLKYERNKLNRKLSKVIKAIGTLDSENQRIICYRYFENMKIKDIALKVGYSEKTIQRRIDKAKLTLSRILFGFEDEFFKAILDFEE